MGFPYSILHFHLLTFVLGLNANRTNTPFSFFLAGPTLLKHKQFSRPKWRLCDKAVTKQQDKDFKKKQKNIFIVHFPSAASIFVVHTRQNNQQTQKTLTSNVLATVKTLNCSLNRRYCVILRKFTIFRFPSVSKLFILSSFLDNRGLHGWEFNPFSDALLTYLQR